MRKQIYCLLSLLWISCLSVSAADRWVINPAGGITWQIDERVPHEDHIEMCFATEWMRMAPLC